MGLHVVNFLQYIRGLSLVSNYLLPLENFRFHIVNDETDAVRVDHVEKQKEQSPQ